MFPRAEPEVERRERNKIEGLRKRNQERVDRLIRNPRNRQIGLNVDALEDQRKEKLLKMALYKSDDKTRAEEEKAVRNYLDAADRERRDISRSHLVSLKSSWASQVDRKKEQTLRERREFVKNPVGRISFAGEDEGRDGRVREQRKTQREWLDEQIEQKRKRNASKVDANMDLAEQWKTLDARQTEIEKQIHKNRLNRYKNVMRENQDRARKRKEEERRAREADLASSRKILDAVAAEDRAASLVRARPLTSEQLKAIRDEQASQRDARRSRFAEDKRAKDDDYRSIRLVERATARFEDAKSMERARRDREHFEQLRRQIDEAERKKVTERASEKSASAFGDSFFAKFGRSAR
eukprot:g3139.t1